MEDSEKFIYAMNNLKPEAGFCYHGDYPMTEEKYATVEWVTGVEADGETAVTTTVNSHTELTWTKVNAELTRLQTEYDSLDYARKRKDEYPSIEELVVALYDSEDKTEVDEKRAAVKLKYSKP